MATEQTAVQTSLAQMRAPAHDSPVSHNVVMGFNSQQGFELMQRGAKLLAASTLVPTSYQQNIPNCVIALNMASRLGADPLLVMQNLYVVHGRPAWSAQFLIATFNQCGRFSAIRYRWTGTEGKDDWSCQAYATERDTSEVITGPVVSIAIAKKEGWYEKQGSKWKTIPQLMLMYRAAGWFVRTHAPELSMGLQTAEEVNDVYDAERGDNGQYAVDMESLRSTTSKTPSSSVVTEEQPEQQQSGEQAGVAATASSTTTPVALADAKTLLGLCKSASDIERTMVQIGNSYGTAEIPSAIIEEKNARIDALRGAK